MDALKKELEEEYQEALKENEKNMAEMQKKYEDMLKEAEENDAVSISLYWLIIYMSQYKKKLYIYYISHKAIVIN